VIFAQITGKNTMKVKIITSTVRPGRKGPVIGKWVTEAAEKFGFEAELLDLGVVNLPLMDEAVHPILKQYEHEHTKQWSAKIEEADAFIFVTAEYDYNYPAPLKNALEYLVHEWAYKPSGIVSYSIGPFAGVRAGVHLKADLISLRNIGLAEMVTIPSFNQFINEDGNFIPNELLEKSVEVMFIQLKRWAKGLKAIKEDQ
jgi:NAD(P)H-dependent FMN reductase